MPDFVVGLGSNLGSREAFVRAAVRLLGAELEIVALSAPYLTAPLCPPQPCPPQPAYVNAAVRVCGDRTARELLALTSSIERALGRVRDVRWGPRTIDLDLLWASDGRVDEPDLVVPHPGLADRAFAIAPLLDVAPEVPLADRLAELGAPPARAWSSARRTGDRIEVAALDDADALALALLEAHGGRGPLAPLDTAGPAELVRTAPAGVVIEHMGPPLGALSFAREKSRAPEKAWDLLDLREGRCTIVARTAPKLL